MDNLRVGDRAFCSSCKAETRVKAQRRLDGWTVVGEDLVCALCGHVLLSMENRPSDTEEQKDSSEKVTALANFLSEELPTRQRLVDEEEGRFCRDCVHFLKHPFVSRCLLHDREVEPMDDCEDFEKAVPNGRSAEQATSGDENGS